LTLTFADDVSLALALAKHSADAEVAGKQFASEGAVAFTKWVDALVLAYFHATGSYFGTPELYDPSSRTG
jgi:Ni,Fe-hydrogenase I cytochrome b subunit